MKNLGARKDVSTYNSASKAEEHLHDMEIFFHPKGAYNADLGTRAKSVSVARLAPNHVRVRFADGVEQHYVLTFTPTIWGTKIGKFRVSTYQVKK